jgi:predicted NAD-dependent protein-ADP-ribosyltransferase YbiA (DUF1768 family)
MQDKTPKYQTRSYIRGFKSPLSNTRLTYFGVDGIKFNSMAQYFNYHKAKHFGLEDLAQQILKAKTPIEAFHLGKNIIIPPETAEEQKAWISDEFKIMEKGLRQKV